MLPKPCHPELMWRGLLDTPTTVILSADFASHPRSKTAVEGSLFISTVRVSPQGILAGFRDPIPGRMSTGRVHALFRLSFRRATPNKERRRQEEPASLKRVRQQQNPGFAYQQNLTGRKLAIIIIRPKSSRLDDLIPQAPACRDAICKGRT
jgi:hypothetical protein